MSDPAQHDSRHARREKVLQLLFASTFEPDAIDRTRSEEALKERPNQNLLDLLDALPEIDAQIQAVATERPLDQINKVDLAILRLSMFESLQKKTPKKVLLNEAIELAKTYSDTQSPAFINAVLAKLLLE